MVKSWAGPGHRVYSRIIFSKKFVVQYSVRLSYPFILVWVTKKCGLLPKPLQGLNRLRLWMNMGVSKPLEPGFRVLNRLYRHHVAPEVSGQQVLFTLESIERESGHAEAQDHTPAKLQPAPHPRASRMSHWWWKISE